MNQKTFLKMLDKHNNYLKEENEKLEKYFKKSKIVLEMIKIANNINLDNWIEIDLKILKLKMKFMKLNINDKK